MGLTVGIVGLPNAGKSTFFQALTQSNALVGTYPFTTVEPNIGAVPVPDQRLMNISRFWPTAKVIPAMIEFVDIAGLIKGASQGEGLGNAFLSQIRNTNLICLVVRCFVNDDVIHVEKTINPRRDIEILMLELMLADQNVIKKRQQKLKPKLKATNDPALKLENELLIKLNDLITNNQWIKINNFNFKEQIIIRELNLLSSKNVVIAANVDEQTINNFNESPYFENLKAISDEYNFPMIPFCAQIEADIRGDDPEEQAAFWEEFFTVERGLPRLIQVCFQSLGLAVFFTAGPKEVRAWIFKIGTDAPHCAGIIHTDFIKHFIRAEVYTYDQLMEYKSEKILKNKGLIRLEGKEYLIQNGDICFFRVSS